MTGIAIACGMVAGLGLILIIRGTSRPQLRLADAMAALDRRQPAQVETDTRPAGLEGLGHQLHRGIGLPLTQTQQRLLNLQGRTVGDFFVADVQGRHEAQHVRPRLQQQHSLGSGVVENFAGTACLARLEHCAKHQAAPTDFRKETELIIDGR